MFFSLFFSYIFFHFYFLPLLLPFRLPFFSLIFSCFFFHFFILPLLLLLLFLLLLFSIPLLLVLPLLLFSSASSLSSPFLFSNLLLLLLQFHLFFLFLLFSIPLLLLLPLLLFSSASSLLSSFLLYNLPLLLLPLLHPSSSSPSFLYSSSTSSCGSISYSSFTSFFYSFSPASSSSYSTLHQSPPHHTIIPLHQHCAFRYVPPFITSHCSSTNTLFSVMCHHSSRPTSAPATLCSPLCPTIHHVPLFPLQFDWNVTRNENMADISGLQIAYSAWRLLQEGEAADPRLPGLNLNTRKLFFLSAAQVIEHDDFTHRLSGAKNRTNPRLCLLLLGKCFALCIAHRTIIQISYSCLLISRGVIYLYIFMYLFVYLRLI